MGGLESLPVAARDIRRALERLRAGDWQGAHELVQALEGAAAARLHGLLHRMEGDLDNARYWYRRAGGVLDISVPLDEELRHIESGLQVRPEAAR